MEKESIKKTIGLRLNTLLAVNNVSQKALANELGVLPNVVSYYCNGSRMPNTEQIIKIARFFNVSTDYILGLSECMTNDTKVKDICDYVGLPDKSIDLLHEFYLHHKWCVDTLAELLFNDDFLHILRAINNLKSDSEMFREKWLDFLNDGQGTVNLSVKDLDIIRYSAVRLMENVLNCYDFRLDKDYYDLEKRIEDAIDVDLLNSKK